MITPCTVNHLQTDIFRQLPPQQPQLLQAQQQLQQPQSLQPQQKLQVQQQR